jgi:hypothetical protein
MIPLATMLVMQEVPWLVGEGMLLLVTPTHCYIARIKPSSGSLLLLYSIPQPHPSQLQTAAGGATAAAAQVPAAAWLPHHRRQQGGVTQIHGEMLMPVAVLALAWGPRLVLFNVPLIGDQSGGGDTGKYQEEEEVGGRMGC